MAKGQEEPQLTFILQDGPSGRISGLNLSDVNAHVARVQQQRKRDPEPPPSKSPPPPRRPLTVYERIKEKKKQHQQQKPFATHVFASRNQNERNAPTPIVLAGNSDPFASTTIAVTPSVNHLLIFTRDFILPANHGNEAALYGGKMHMHRYWRDSVRGLDDGGADGYAYLARSAAILSGIKPQNETTLLALEYISKATSKLRESMLQRADSQTHVWEVYALLAAEVAAHNFKAAAVHGRMLARLLQPEGKTVQSEPRLLMGALLQDMTRACLSLTRPSLNLDRWDAEHLPKHIIDEIPPEGRDSPSALPFYEEVAPSLPSSFAALVLGVRDWHHALGMVMIDKSLTTPKVFTNAAMKIMVLSGHFLTHYLDSIELWALLPSPELLVDACLALAAAYWVRRAVHDRMDAGSKLEEAGSWAFDMSLVLAERLRELDIEVETHGHELVVVGGEAAEDRLWWLSVGTMAERNVRLRPDCGDYKDYHGVRFVRLAREMGLTEWPDLVAVLRRYLFVEPMGRKTKKWFLANIGANARHGPGDAT
ncbi:hypothetical protein PV04_06396 [Phialophora macrospora]|uniref:Transcription factor domain-containing protein n=1 Tax=Phialophora macrospora TaxID=1851006 RepID=A0A0D2FGD9_9EURO|nr:hypothetical protein PV04_06396 [Phialophora macrospora]